MELIQRWGRLLVVAAALTGCAVNPVTGERELALVSESQEIAIGKQGAEQVRQTMALVEDPELQAYVDRLGQQLAAASERPELPWSFGVIDDPTPNAFALPGGPIFVTRGLLALMDSEAELVTVLGHEIGHITARHSVAQMSRAQLAQLGLGLGMILVPEVRSLGDVAGLGLNLLMLKYGRDAERQADDLGFRYARSQGYDVSEMADVFAALQQAGELAGQSPIPNWMASHPAPEERIEAVEERLQNLPANQFESTVGRAEFLGMLEGLAYGNNPRNGFFRDDVFYHPDLRFRFAVPSEWQKQNLPQAVLGVSPNQNAAFQFTLAPASSAAEAMRAFAAQEGLQLGPTSTDRINGVPAVTAAFQAQAQQGVVAGYVTFYEQGEKVFQLVTYSPADVFESYRESFQTMIESFAPLNDPAILSVQPAEIGIARLPRPMTLVEFARWSESTIPLEELALINQVQNPEATIEAGTLLKQVRGGVGETE